MSIVILVECDKGRPEAFKANTERQAMLKIAKWMNDICKDAEIMGDDEPKLIENMVNLKLTGSKFEKAFDNLIQLLGWSYDVY